MLKELSMRTEAQFSLKRREQDGIQSTCKKVTHTTSLSLVSLKIFVLFALFNIKTFLTCSVFFYRFLHLKFIPKTPPSENSFFHLIRLLGLFFFLFLEIGTIKSHAGLAFNSSTLQSIWINITGLCLDFQLYYYKNHSAVIMSMIYNI